MNEDVFTNIVNENAEVKRLEAYILKYIQKNCKERYQELEPHAFSFAKNIINMYKYLNKQIDINNLPENIDVQIACYNIRKYSVHGPNEEYTKTELKTTKEKKDKKKIIKIIAIVAGVALVISASVIVAKDVNKEPIKEEEPSIISSMSYDNYNSNRIAKAIDDSTIKVYPEDPTAPINAEYNVEGLVEGLEGRTFKEVYPELTSLPLEIREAIFRLMEPEASQKVDMYSYVGLGSEDGPNMGGR